MNRHKYRLFMKSLDSPKQIQEERLLQILEANAQTQYGQKYNFDKIGSIADYQEQVPLTTYEDYQPYIDQIAAGQDGILTTESVSMLELSSGTTSPSKYIPYTKSLKEEFQWGIAPWIYDLYTNKNLLDGKSYWSITPVNHSEEKTEGGIPIGFEEDSEYFGFIQRLILNKIFLVPNQVSKIKDIITFRYITLLFLIKEKRLTFISVWNPTFLILLLKPLRDWHTDLIGDLKRGKITPPSKLDSNLKKVLEKRLGQNKNRARELEEIFLEDGSSIYSKIWPNLKVISCWTDAKAGRYLPQLQTLFPNVDIQGKGLLATEGFITLPLADQLGSVLASRSHFFEFIEYSNGKMGQIRLASQLEVGKTYSVVITTGGGFYRYQLQDLVKVIGFTKDTPRLIFVGKEAKVSDYFGEKLNENFVEIVLSDIFEEYGINPVFYMMAPEVNSKGQYFYTLFLEYDASLIDKKMISRMEDELEERLCSNYHYAYCRRLDQLKPSRIFNIKAEGLETYLETCRQSGQKLGDIKPVTLHTKTGWKDKFQGQLI